MKPSNQRPDFLFDRGFGMSVNHRLWLDRVETTHDIRLDFLPQEPLFATRNSRGLPLSAPLLSDAYEPGF